MKKKVEMPNEPMVTGAVSKELGVMVSKEFLTKKLKIKPLFETKTTAYWDDINLIRSRMGSYFTRTSRL